MRATPNPPPSALQQKLAARIVEAARAGEPGAALSELGLAQALGVSRSPVRAALAWLQGRNVMKREPGSGWVLTSRAARSARIELAPPVEEPERLFVAIARDRVQGALAGDTTEADLMRRYGVTRPTVLKVLARLAEVGLVERKRGHGWSFLPVGYDDAARAESYAFRLLVEPAALSSTGFRLAPAWAAAMRSRHEAMLSQPWRETSSVALFDLNAEFHEGLAAASGNRFLLMAIQQQNRLRRFVNIHWTDGPERVQVSCQEHLEILARAEAGQTDVAAALMRQHLLQASRL